MLYNCPCDSRVIEIPTPKYFTMSDNELEMHCTSGNGCEISNPFYGSYAETNGIMLTREEAEEIEEIEYEEDNRQYESVCELNLPPDYYEV